MSFSDFISNQYFEKTLLYVKYSDDEYEKAKEYIIKQQDLDIFNDLSFNSYHFYLNQLEVSFLRHFPSSYIMTGYNDEQNILIFIGMYCSEKSYPEVQYGLTDFGLYLKTFFGEWYNFDDGLE